MAVITSKNLKDTEEFAEKTVAFLAGSPAKKATVLCLYGDLGSGKTTFTQILGRLLGVKETIQSPTFVIMKSYKLPSSPLSTFNFKLLTHIDAYRIENPQEMLNLGFEDMLNNKDNLVVIEWPERIKDILPKDTYDFYFKFVNETTRKIKSDLNFKS